MAPSNEVGPADVDNDEITEPDDGLYEPAEHLLGLPRQVFQAQPDDIFFAPTDPVVVGDALVGGFSPTAMDSLEVDASALDNVAGDEALADAVRQELRADAATNALDIDVSVKNHIAYLHGLVADVEDAENAEEVASRLPQVVEVIDQLDVEFD